MLSLCIALCIVAFALLVSRILAPKMLRLLGFADRTPIRNSAEAVQQHRLPKENPGLPSQARAVDNDHPAGTPGWHADGSKTVLQQVRSALRAALQVQPFYALLPRPHPRRARALMQHVDFFDPDHDGIIMPWDTYTGFRRIGYGRVISFMAVLLIHSSFSFPTWPDWTPRLSMPIFVERAHRMKHGSDSDTYDTEGRFTPERFEEIFSKYSTVSGKDGKPALSWDDINDMIHGNQNINDFAGWIATRSEWWILWWVAKDEQGLLSKERIRATMDGSIFPILEQEASTRRGYSVYPQLKEANNAPTPAHGRSESKKNS